MQKYVYTYKPKQGCRRTNSCIHIVLLLLLPFMFACLLSELLMMLSTCGNITKLQQYKHRRPCELHCHVSNVMCMRKSLRKIPLFFFQWHSYAKEFMLSTNVTTILKVCIYIFSNNARAMLNICICTLSTITKLPKAMCLHNFYY